jgi:hypothetical protein
VFNRIMSRCGGFYEVIGYVGSVTLLGSYGLMVKGIIDGPGMLYNIGMFVGCAALGVNLWAHRSWPGVWVEVAFCAIAFLALVKNFY